MQKQKKLITELEEEKTQLQREIEKNLEEIRLIDREHKNQEAEIEQEYSEFKDLMTQKVSEMKLFKAQTEKRM